MTPIHAYPAGSEPARTVRRGANGHFGYVAGNERPPQSPPTMQPLPCIPAITQTTPAKATMTGDPTDVYTGCLAWQLPADQRCASVARALTGSTLTRLGLSADLIDSAQLAISELATNAYQHGLGRGHTPLAHNAVPCLCELWVYARHAPTRQLMLKVFDCGRDWDQPPATGDALLQEHGRGLTIVDAVSAQTGMHRTRSRLAPWPVPGKCVWFTLPLPDTQWPTLSEPAPGQAARHLATLLAARGVGPLQCADSGTVSMVSVKHGPTVWIHNSISWRNSDGSYTHHPLTNLQEVAEQVVRLHEETQPPPDWPPQSQHQ